MTGDQEQRAVSGLVAARDALGSIGYSRSDDPAELRAMARAAKGEAEAALNALSADAVSSPDTDRCVCEPGKLPGDQPHDPRCPLSPARSSSVPSPGRCERCGDTGVVRVHGAEDYGVSFECETCDSCALGQAMLHAEALEEERTDLRAWANALGDTLRKVLLEPDPIKRNQMAAHVLSGSVSPEQEATG